MFCNIFSVIKQRARDRIGQKLNIISNFLTVSELPNREWDYREREQLHIFNSHFDFSQFQREIQIVLRFANIFSAIKQKREIELDIELNIISNFLTVSQLEKTETFSIL